MLALKIKTKIEPVHVWKHHDVKNHDPMGSIGPQ